MEKMDLKTVIHLSEKCFQGVSYFTSNMRFGISATETLEYISKTICKFYFIFINLRFYNIQR